MVFRVLREVGIPQTLSLNNGILPLSHNGGSVTLPQINLSQNSIFKLNNDGVFSAGSVGQEVFDDYLNYMIINNSTGHGFIHLDFLNQRWWVDDSTRQRPKTKTTI